MKIYKAKIDYLKCNIKLQFPIFGKIIHKESKSTNTNFNEWDNSDELILVQNTSNKTSDVKMLKSDEPQNNKNKHVKIKNEITKYTYDPEKSIEEGPSSVKQTKSKKRVNDRNYFK